MNDPSAYGARNASRCPRVAAGTCGNLSLRGSLAPVPRSDLRLLHQRAPQVISSSYASLSEAERIWDGKGGRWVAYLYPNEYFATRDDVTIAAQLSCCIAVCLSDPVAAIGGMSHFTVPQLQCPARRNRTSSLAASSGCRAMETLIDSVLRLGAEPRRLRFGLAGAAHTLAGHFDTSARNLEFVRDYLQSHGWSSQADHVGGIQCRAIEFHAGSGRTRVRSLSAAEAAGVARRDMTFLTDIQRTGRGRFTRASGAGRSAG